MESTISQKIATLSGAASSTGANARLIAAAPDYAEGVEMMLLNEECGGNGWWDGWRKLKAAHTKAKGGDHVEG